MTGKAKGWKGGGKEKKKGGGQKKQRSAGSGVEMGMGLVAGGGRVIAR